jgi:glycerol-3-phosphate dehydrogenase
MRNGVDAHLADRFGSELNRVKELIAQDPSLGQPLINGLPYLRAEAVFACRDEMAQTLDDVLSRRTRARIINRRATLASARKVAELMATELHWDAAEIDRQVAFFVDSCSREEAAGLVSEAEFLASVQ